MLRLTALKIGFLSVLGSIMLLLGLLASTGTASAYTGGNGYPVVPQRPQPSAYVVSQTGPSSSAYTGGNGYPVVPQRPQLSAYVVSQTGPSSIEVLVSGSGFRSGVVFLSATAGGQRVSVQPMTVRTNRNGSFSVVVRIRQPFQLPYRTYPTQIVLHATGLFGRSANQVLLLSRFPYQAFQYGLVR